MCPASVGTSRSSRALETGAAKLWVLLVGVNQYEDDRIPALAYSALDCQGLGEAIEAATQTFPEKSVMIHHDFAESIGITAIDTAAKEQPKQPPQLPRLDRVRFSLQQIVSEAKPEDTVLFYFSGHGMLASAEQPANPQLNQPANQPVNQPVNQPAVLCLTDTRKDDLSQTGLAVQELLQTLGTCAAHQQLVWLDACHSGGMSLRTAKGESETLSNPTLQLVELLRQRAAQSRGFYALLSCDQTQQSWEFPELGHGVFTYYLMRGLLGEAADEQGVIEADALYKYVYYQTLRYIDKTNQQLRLINQQTRGRGESQLQPEYPLQTPKRIVEGVGELILGLKPTHTDLRYPRQSLVIDGLGSTQMSLALSKVLRGAGGFELNFLPQAGKVWADVQDAIQACLRSTTKTTPAQPTAEETALLYLRGTIEQTETGESLLVLRDEARISRSWLRQVLRRSPIARQIVILDCPGATDLAAWVEDLQIAGGRGQCLIAAAAPADESDLFAQALLSTLTAADPQTGLPIAGWIALLQSHLAAIDIMPHLWLSGTQGVIEVLPGKTGSRGSDAEGFDLGLCPYLGLRSFGEDDAPFFFGREALILQLLNALSEQCFLAVVGASGSGKSSVVQAGLLTQLRQGKQIPGSESWWIRSLRPGDRPLDALAKRLVDSGTEKERGYQQLQIEGLLHLGAEGFVQWLRSRPEPMVVLAIDQFEELFTLSPAADRQQFLDLILGAVEHAGDRFKLVITLRTDFIAPCLEIPTLAVELQRSSLLVPPHLAAADYRQIIIKPAEKVGLKVEPELVEVLLQELSHGAGDLPLLEFVLEQVWQHRHPGELTLQVYQQQIGGLKGALERKAQAVFDSLDPEAQACARWIFLALTQLGEGTEDTRRRVLRADLIVKKYPAALVDRTLQALTTAKLVVVSLEEGMNDEGGRMTEGRSKDSINSSLIPYPSSFPQTSIEVAHEILIRHWSTLRWWLEENRSRLRSQRQIEQAAQQWQQSGEQADFLMQGVRLDAAEELYVKYTDELPQEVQRFIEAGLADRSQRQQETRRQLKRAQIAIVLIGTLGTIAASFGGFAYFQRQQAQLNGIATLNALSESQLLANQQLEALTTSLEAEQQLRQINGFGLNARTVTNLRTQTVSTLQQAVETTQERNRLEGHSQQVNSVSISRDGTIASSSDDGTMRLWKPDGTLIRTLQNNDRITSVAWSPNGTIAAGGRDRVVKIWNLDGTISRALSGQEDQITSVAWSPDGQVLASASRDRTVKLWSVSTEQSRTLAGHTGWVNAVAFSPDGRTAATASEDKTIKLWNVMDGRLIRTLTGHSDRVTSVAFSPDGNLASGSGDRSVRLWNLANGSSQVLAGHQDQVNHVAFSPDGATIVSASQDATLNLWRVKNGSLLEVLRGHGAAVLSASFSPDGQTIASASADKSLKLWSSPVQTSAFVGVDSFDSSHDGKTWAMVEDRAVPIGGDSIQVLRGASLAEAKPLQTLARSDAPVSTLSFSSSDRMLASGDQDKTIRLWNPETGGLLHTLNGHQAKITSLSFSPDDRFLASASEDKTVRLWNPSNGSLIRTLTGHQDGVAAVAFSPTGTRLVSGSYDNTVKLWQTDGTLVRTLEGHQLAIAALTFSPDGETIASASWDNAIKLWRVRDGALLKTLSGHQDGVTSISYSADGSVLASGSADQTIKLWSAEGTLLKTLQKQPEPIRGLSYPDDKTLIAWMSASQAAGVVVLNLDSDDLRKQGCNRLHDYLHTNRTVSERDRSVCRNVGL